MSKKPLQKGVFKQMLDELKSSYPALGLDCPVELVSFYEHLGFYVDKQQGTHVGMITGVLGGANWSREDDFLDHSRIYQRAKASVRDKLGKKVREAYAKRDAETKSRHAEAKAYVAGCMAG